MRKFLCFLICVVFALQAYPAFSAPDNITVKLGQPRTNTLTSFTVKLVQNKAISKGDWIKINFASKEVGQAGQEPAPGCDYNPLSNRRFCPGPIYAGSCKDNKLAFALDKVYLLDIKAEGPKVQPLKDFQDSYIPGFLMPPLSKDNLEARVKTIFSGATVGGYACQAQEGCKINSALSERSVTLLSPADFSLEQAQEGILITLGDTFGLFTAQTTGDYPVEVSSAASPTPKNLVISIFEPIITKPDFSINPPFPDEPSTWAFTFETGGAGELRSESLITVKLPKGFATRQVGTIWSISVNRAQVPQGSKPRINETPSGDILMFYCPAIVAARSQVKVELSGVLNPPETGPIECSVYTSSDTKPVVFPEASIIFEQAATSDPPDASVPAFVTMRFKAKGFGEGEEAMIVLPQSSKLFDNPTLSINGQPYKRVSFGERSAQFVLPFRLESGKHCRMTLGPLSNPPAEGESIKLTFGTQEYALPWNIKPYNPSFTVICDPPIANSPCTWNFIISPPENLTPEERKTFTIGGPWNRALSPVEGEVRLFGQQAKAQFDGSLLKIELANPIESRKTLTVSMPPQSGFGTPDASGTFTLFVGAEKLICQLGLKESPPAVVARLLNEGGKPLGPTKSDWVTQPVKIKFFASNPKAKIEAFGLTHERVEFSGQDGEFILPEQAYIRGGYCIASDSRGQGLPHMVNVMVDTKPLTAKISSGAVSPNQSYKLQVQVAKKIIKTADGRFYVVEPRVSALNKTREIKVSFEQNAPEETFTAEFLFDLQVGENAISVVVEDQAGHVLNIVQKVQFKDERPEFLLAKGQETSLSQGLQTIKCVTTPNASVLFMERETKADDKGNFAIQVKIEAGFNTLAFKITIESGAQSEIELTISGKRFIKIKLDSTIMHVDGKPVQLKVAPTNNFKKNPKIPSFYNGTTFVPLRDIATALMAEVAFDDKTKMISITQKRPLASKVIKIKLGSPVAVVDGKEVTLSTEYLIAPVVINGTAMVPLRFVSEQLGSKVGYDSATKSITIDWPDEQKMPDVKPVKIGK